MGSERVDRFNAVYENSDSYRKFVNLERYGLNPTFTYAPSAVTKIQLSYEYFHDQRTTDRVTFSNNIDPIGLSRVFDGQ